MPGPLRMLAPWEPMTVASKLDLYVGVGEGLRVGVGVAVTVGLIEGVADIDTDVVAVGVGFGRLAPPFCPRVSTVVAATPMRTTPMAMATAGLRWCVKKDRVDCFASCLEARRWQAAGQRSNVPSS